MKQLPRQLYNGLMGNAMPDIRIHIHRQGTEPKSAELICNWCQEPHAVEPSYREEALKRGAKEIAKLKADNHEMPDDLTPEQSWTCGKCLVHLEGLPSEFKTDCHEHEVPTERRFRKTNDEIN